MGACQEQNSAKPLLTPIGTRKSLGAGAIPLTQKIPFRSAFSPLGSLFDPSPGASMRSERQDRGGS